MKKLPSVNLFLDEIDPKKTVDREKAVGELAAVALLQATMAVRGILSDEKQKSLDNILKDDKNVNFDIIYDLYADAGKTEQLLDSINENVIKVRKDYMKTHYDAMPQAKKDTLHTKFPALKEL